jgi:Tat protein secretion system quality control protein TatD with DNase activity
VEVLFSEHIRDIAGSIPPHLLLTETDNPVGIMWYQEVIREGMPPLIRDVCSALAAIHRMTPDDLAGRIMENFQTLTKDDPHLTGYFENAARTESAPA